MDLSIVIVSWNVRDRLKDNLKSIYASGLVGLSMEIFVIDNASRDGTVQMVKNEFPSVNVIANTENLGFAKANNQAIQKAGGRYILLLNPDMRVQADTLKNMVDWMDKNQKATVAGCRLEDQDKKVIKHVRNFPTFWNQLAIILKLPHIMPWILNSYILKKFDYNKAQRVDSVRGSFFMIRNDGKQSSGLDERYFIWFEEVDYCREINKNGGEVWYTPAATCVDYVGASFNQTDFIKKQLYMRDSMLKYFQKWHSGLETTVLRFFWALVIFFLKLSIKKNEK